MDVEALVALASAVATEVGRSIAPVGPAQVRTKAGWRDLVTEADLAAERHARRLLRASRPHDAIVGEELDDEAGTSGLRWAVDPIDGTTNFVSGIPHWCVSVGCEDDAGSLVGAVYDPNSDELVAAGRGAGVRRNGEPVATTPADRADQAVLAWGVDIEWHARRPRIDTIERLLPAVAHGRQMGSMALDMAWCALGRFDAYYYEAGMHPHDVGQRVLLIEAGWRVHLLPARPDLGPAALLAAPQPVADVLLQALGRAAA